ncbi:hypothetical protein DEM34_14710 [Spiribacter halobius]|uniref:2-isopropylmalate synthase LeuA allosteric (dimerisation) domain-containing protein n=2 Tax=Sediminicurvatus halobius TaxID=2182432 RepID=A0A2U2MYA5_9GAMM|nr:hypothetical protein DEM34_14710 [Spiribacter halobius]
MPIKRIIEIFSIRPQTVYDIIDRAYEACLVFAAERETQLGAKTAGRGAIHIATDRQSYTLNWRLRADKRNTVLRAIVSTEVLSGYVFPVHLNYDARSDVTQVNEMAMLLGDPTDSVGTEVNAQQMWQMFPDEYLNASGAVECLGHKLFDAEDCQGIRLRVKTARGEETWDGVGNGPIDATLKALGADVRVQHYDEHSMGTGSDARAVTFVELAAEGLHGDVFGVGIDPNIITASVRAIVSGINRVCRHRPEVLPGAL